MPELVIAVGMSRPAGMFGRLVQQVSAAKIPLHIHPLPNEIPNGNLGSLRYKLESMRELLAELKGFRKVVICDAWDVLFYGSRDELEAKIPADGLILAGERNCYPEPHLTGFPAGFFQYVNGGGMAGSYDAIVEWIDKIAYEGRDEEMMTAVDQKFLNRLRRVDSPLTPVDTDGNIFYTMTTESGQLVNQDGRPFNKFTNAKPHFIHFCGKLSPSNFLSMMHEAPIA